MIIVMIERLFLISTKNNLKEAFRFF